MSLPVAGLLFFVLSPGVLLTIPPGSRGLFLSGQTSVLAALIHAVVFVAVAHLLTTAVEGFMSGPNMNTMPGPNMITMPGPNVMPGSGPAPNMMREGYRNRY
jgi:hypothetical protein